MTFYISKIRKLEYIINYLLILCIFLLSGFLYKIDINAPIIDKTTIFVLSIIITIPILYIQKKSIIPTVKKIAISKNELTMISLNKRKTTVDLKSDIYYEIIYLFVDRYAPSRRFIVVSNSPFESLAKIKGIAKVCQLLDKKQNIVIIPYNEETIPLLNTEAWIELS